MRWYWHFAISVAAASLLGVAFYTILGNLAYVLHGTSPGVRPNPPLMILVAALTLPFTAACALLTDELLRRALGQR